jgi:hypothetical protein
VNPAGRGASVNQAMNSSSPRLYTRRVIGEETLSSTSDFNLRQSEARSATTSSFIVKSFHSRYLAISEANRTLAPVAEDVNQTSEHRERPEQRAECVDPSPDKMARFGYILRSRITIASTSTPMADEEK